ncbi:MAG: glycosyltransferase family 2 protein [bacterium]
MNIDLSIIIVTFNNADAIAACIQSIFDRTENLRFETIVVDNGSSDGTAEVVKARFPDVLCIQAGQNLGFAAATNIGLLKSVGEYIILLNPDTQLLNNALFILVEFLRNHREAGAVGGLLMQDETTPQRTYSLANPSVSQAFFDTTGLSKWFYGKVPSMGIIPDEKKFQNKKVTYIPGADLMFRRSELERVGLMDERFFMFGEDCDWCLRLNRETGLGVYFVPAARIRHELGGSAGKRSIIRARMAMKSQFRFINKHHGLFKAMVTRCLYLTIYTVKLAFAALRYGVQPAKRDHWKAEILYYATILKVSFLPDRFVSYL